LNNCPWNGSIENAVPPVSAGKKLSLQPRRSVSIQEPLFKKSSPSGQFAAREDAAVIEKNEFHEKTKLQILRSYRRMIRGYGLSGLASVFLYYYHYGTLLFDEVKHE
jgi:hypothetical protein